MYLSDIETHGVHEYIGSEIPPYAILSHRWGDQELTFEEVFKKRIDQSKQGYQKLLGACRTSVQYGVKYLWIDTCCIDKKSSAELSEAINSTFVWYKNAQVCLAYLEDIPANVGYNEEVFRKSVWFTRCWTLQELLAPRDVDFFDHDWKHIGDKKGRCYELDKITGIIHDVLNADNHHWIQSTSATEKMSWAFNRHATRSEDVAYSLIGLFQVNMPLLYGEGENAFVRLQQEIVRCSDDSSTLIWVVDQLKGDMFAKSPADFMMPYEGFDPCKPRFGEGRVLQETRQHTIGFNNIGLEIGTRLTKHGHNRYGVSLGYDSYTGSAVILIIGRCFSGRFYHKIGVFRVNTESKTP